MMPPALTISWASLHKSSAILRQQKGGAKNRWQLRKNKAMSMMPPSHTISWAELHKSSAILWQQKAGTKNRWQ